MNIASIRPSTVDGIKNLAKQIKRERNISHTSALEVASKQAGYDSFLHARKTLSFAIAQGLFPVFLSIHWYEPRSGALNEGALGSNAVNAPPRRRFGREILRVDLSRPLPMIVAKQRVDWARGLGGFTMEYVDHLEHRTLADSQEAARQRLVTADQSLRFMEASGLQPVNRQADRDRLRMIDELPGRDHTSSWFDPESGAVAVLDEPYPERLADYAAAREKWLAQHGFAEVKLPWQGIHNPGQAVAILVSNDPALLDRVSKAVARLPPYAIPDPWVIETGRMGHAFVSPKRTEDGKARRPIPDKSYTPRMGAIPYGGGFGIRSWWRPSQTMRRELHMELGALIMQTDDVDLSEKIHNKLRVHYRSRLEEWANLEYPGSDLGYEAYYGQRNLKYFGSRAQKLAALARAKAIVEEGYNDCKPRRGLLAAIDAFIVGIKNLS